MGSSLPLNPFPAPPILLVRLSYLPDVAGSVFLRVMLRRLDPSSIFVVTCRSLSTFVP